MEPDSESDPPAGGRDSDSPESESPDGGKLDLPVPVGGAGVTVGVTGIQVAGQTLGRRVRSGAAEPTVGPRSQAEHERQQLASELASRTVQVRDRTDPTVMVTAQATTR